MSLPFHPYPLTLTENSLKEGRGRQSPQNVLVVHRSIAIDVVLSPDLEDRYVDLVAKKNRNFPPDKTPEKPCNHYRYICFSKNHLTAIKSLWFVCTETNYLLPSSTTLSSGAIRWCKEHVGWDHQKWSKVMFFDEFWFSVTSDFSHRLLWRDVEHVIHKTLCT
ncbi:hypothetical protein TNCV_3735491 [Trichonephila clavipes]|nr:hypothetical protein TNCV_3735491 [Trichonephila clavipes]